MRDAGPVYAKRVAPVPRAYRRMRGGEAVEIDGRTWRVEIGLGHAPEHACLFREDDHVRLQPENDEHEPIRTREARVLGRVVGVLRRVA